MKRGERTTKDLILQAGKQEFTKNGFQGASMRKIAEAAGVTTGAIYGCYTDKEALFNDLVEVHAEEVLRRFINSQSNFDTSFTLDEKTEQMCTYSESEQFKILEYVYDHLDIFHLIINCSAGTRYAGFVDKMVEVEEKYMLKFIEALQSEGRTSPNITPDVVHLLCNSCFQGMFHIISHDLPREEALKSIAVFSEFYRLSWFSLLGV